MFRKLGLSAAIVVVGLLSGSTTAHAQGCALCVSFVTTWDPDGSGPVPAKTRTHNDLVANVPYSLDVDGTLPPLPNPLPVGLPNDLRVSVAALSGDKATITIERYPAAPLPALDTKLPLRIELVRGDASGWTTLGYDALHSSAPQKFVAEVDLTNRDGDVRTDQALLVAQTTASAKAIALVTETFKGDPAGTRSDRSATRLAYGRTPGRITADVTSPSKAAGAPNRQNIVLTHDGQPQPRLDFQTSTPTATTSGQVDKLPNRVDLTIAERAETSANVMQIDYAQASSIAKDVVVVTRSGGKSTRAEIGDLPKDAHVTYASPKQAGGETRVTYHADSRATRAKVISDDGKRKLTASLTNVPRNIAKLSFVDNSSCSPRPPRRCVESGDIVYDSDAEAQVATIDLVEGVKQIRAELERVPADIGLKYSTSPSNATVNYDASGVATRADVVILDEDAQRIHVDLRDFPAVTDFSYAKRDLPFVGNSTLDGLSMTYRASSDVPVAKVDATNLKGGVAKDVQLDMTRVPVNLDFSFEKELGSEEFDIQVQPPEKECPAPLPVPAPPECLVPYYDHVRKANDRLEVRVDTPPVPGRPRIQTTLGSLVFSLASGELSPLEQTGPSGRQLNGVKLRDTPAGKSLYARMTGFDALSLKRTAQSERRTGNYREYYKADGQTAVELDTAAADRAFAVDLLQGDVQTRADMVSLPPNLRLDMTDHDDEFDWKNMSKVSYSAGQQVQGVGELPGFQLVERNLSRNIVTKLASLNPMPAKLTTCQQSGWHDCTRGVFDANINALRTGNYDYIGNWRCVELAGDCGGWALPISPVGPEHGSNEILVEQGDPVHLIYQTRKIGQPDVTEVNLRNLLTFRLQADSGTNDCGLVQDQDCKVGYLAMDTAGQPIWGAVRTSSAGSSNEFVFPNAGAGSFQAQAHVWAFNEVGYSQGETAIQGPVTCPDHTRIVAAGKTLTRQFCEGHLTDGWL